MNLAAGVLFSGGVLLGMALLCCAHAADDQADNAQHQVAVLNSDQSANKVITEVKSADAVQTAPVITPFRDDKNNDALDDPVGQSVQLKGVRG